MAQAPDRERIMAQWDHIREYFQEGDAGGSHPREVFEDVIGQYEDAIAALTRELADLRQTVIAFAGPHAASYAREFGFASGELHPTHYDILERCGARMTDFRRADISTARDDTVSDPE